MRRLSLVVVSVLLGSLATVAAHVSAATWSSTPTLISTLNKNSTSPAFALSDDGTKAVVVWRTTDGANFKIQASSATISKGVATWGTPTDLSTDGRTANFPRVKMSSDGTRATAVWAETDSTNVTRIATSSAIIDGKTSSWGTSKYVSRSGADAQGSGTDLALSSDGTKGIISFIWNSSGTNLAYVSSGSINGGTATWTDSASQTKVSDDGVAAGFTTVDMPSTGGAFVVGWNTPNGVYARAATVVGGVAFLATSSTLVSGTATLTTAPSLQLSADGKSATALFIGKASGAATVGAHVVTGTVSGKETTWAGSPTQISGAGYVASSAVLSVSADGKSAVAGWLRGDGATVKVETIAGTVSGTSGTWGSITSPAESTATKDFYALTVNSTGTAAVMLYANTSNNVDSAMVATGTVAANVLTWGTSSQVSASGKNVYGGKIGVSTDVTNATAVFVTDASGSATYSAIASVSMVTPPSLTLAAVATSATTRNVDFTLTSTTSVDCATLSADDLTLAGISSVTITQKDTKTCAIAGIASTYWGEKGTASVSGAASLSVSDSAGIAATTLAGTASTAVDLTWKVKKGKSISVKTLRQKASMTTAPGTAAVKTSVITTKASASKCKVVKKNGKASSLSLTTAGTCRVKVTDTWTVNGVVTTAKQYVTVTITR